MSRMGRDIPCGPLVIVLGYGVVFGMCVHFPIRVLIMVYQCCRLDILRLDGGTLESLFRHFAIVLW